MYNTLRLTKNKLNRATIFIGLSIVAFFVIYFLFSVNEGFGGFGHVWTSDFIGNIYYKNITLFNYGFPVIVVMIMAGIALLKNESRFSLSLGCSSRQNSVANMLTALFIALLIFLSAIAVILIDRVRFYSQYDSIWTSGIAMTGAEIGIMLGEALVTALLFYVTYMQLLILNIYFTKNKLIFIAVLVVFALIFILFWPGGLIDTRYNEISIKIFNFFYSYKGMSILLSVATVIIAPIYYAVATTGRISR